MGVKPFYNFGDMKQGQNGGYYISVDRLPDGVDELVLKKGDTIQLIKPKDDLQGLVERDIITEEQAEEKLAKIPDFVKFRAKYLPAKK